MFSKEFHYLRLLLMIMLQIVPSYCSEFHCSNISSVHPYSCTFTNLNYNFTSNPVEFSHSDPESTSIVMFTKSNISHIPRKIFDYFPNVKQFDMQYCLLRIIVPDTFVNASNLVHLQLGHNNLTELHDSSFHGLGNLTHLQLAHNQIERISEYAFVDLGHLKILDLSHNFIVQLSDVTFRKMYALETLLLDYNRIKRVDKWWFKDTKKILLISLTHNHINFIHDSAFANGLDELFQLRLSGNRLAKIDMRNIDAENLDIDNNSIRSLHVNKQVKKVLRLDAQSNMISKLRCDHNPKLVGLILTNNSLTDLSCISKMRRLELLFLGQNKIHTIDRSTFVNLINLVTVSLENNEIEFLEPGIFEQQLGLRTLIISNNRLKQFNFNIFASINVVEAIHINANHLTTMSYENIRQLLPHLSIIDLSDNLWQCSYLANILQKFEKLEIKCLKTTDLHINEVNVKGVKCVADLKSNDELKYEELNDKIMKLELEMINNQLNYANVLRKLEEMSHKIMVIEGKHNLTIET
uniref:CSON001282 protein n=1 Tax=Culicoides sonorensis TaxID=179676 RepID=A0A336MGD2_CULSO